MTCQPANIPTPPPLGAKAVGFRAVSAPAGRHSDSTPGVRP